MKEEEYMRVGTTLYKVVNQPCASGGYEKRRVIWNNSTLRQDYGKNYLATVPKYDGFCTVPDHLNYRKEIDGFLNLYEPIEHTPQIGDFPNIRSLVLHIFGEQYNLGLDYLQLLFLQPLQKLPILLLVSEERNTGKSTFLNFLKAVFGDNVTFNTNVNPAKRNVLDLKNETCKNREKRNVLKISHTRHFKTIKAVQNGLLL